MPAKPVSVLMIHGTEDTYDPYEGGETRFGTVMSAHDTFAFWSEKLACSGAVTEPVVDKDPADGTSVTYLHTTSCAAPRVAVGLYTIEGGGHTWPDGARGSRISERVLGKTAHDIGNEEIWAFFAAHVR